MPRTLITGGAGFIGSHLADRLLARGDSVLSWTTSRAPGATRFAGTPSSSWTTSRAPGATRFAGTTTACGSSRARSPIPSWSSRLFEDFRPEVVAHAAASYKDPDDWDEDARTNAVGTANVVQAAERARSAVSSTSRRRSATACIPQEQPITLDHPLDPSRVELRDLEDRGRVVRAA